MSRDEDKIDFEPDEQVIVIFDKNEGHDIMKAMRPSYKGEIIQLQRSHPEAVFRQTHTYSAVVIDDGIYVIQWPKRLFRIKPFAENADWDYLQSPEYFHGPEPPAAILKGSIYVCGGGFQDADTYRRTGEKLAKVTDTCERYDPRNSWDDIANMIYKKRLNSMVEVNGRIYSIGGIGIEDQIKESKDGIKKECEENTSEQNESEQHEVALSLVERYDAGRDTWEVIPSMLQHRIAPAVTSYKGKIYVFGGGDSETDGHRLRGFEGRNYLQSVECFDPLANAWTMLEGEMTSPRIKFRVCLINETIYAVGGNKDGNENVEKAELELLHRRTTSSTEPVEDIWEVTDANWLQNMECNFMATVAITVPH